MRNKFGSLLLRLASLRYQVLMKGLDQDWILRLIILFKWIWIEPTIVMIKTLLTNSYNKFRLIIQLLDTTKVWTVLPPFLCLSYKTLIIVRLSLTAFFKTQWKSLSKTISKTWTKFSFWPNILSKTSFLRFIRNLINWTLNLSFL